MSIPKYRYVEYTDDGCGLSQCLNCYQTWEGRGTHGWAFCPYCGTKWEGQQECRSHTDPAWQWNFTRNGVKLDSHERYMLTQRDTPRLTRGWIVEKRSCHMENGEPVYGKWEFYSRQSDYSRHDIGMLRHVVSFLRSFRDRAEVDHQERLNRCEDVNSFWNHWEEYRASIQTFDHWTYNSSNHIWTHSRPVGGNLVDEWNWTPPSKHENNSEE